MRHVSLRVRELDRCVAFYTEHFGMEVEWRPDDDTAFLTSGHESLALQRADEPPAGDGGKLDHVGFLLEAREDVDRWHAYLAERGVEVEAAPRNHRDGSRSFFCRDPDGTRIQILHHPGHAGG